MKNRPPPFCVTNPRQETPSLPWSFFISKLIQFCLACEHKRNQPAKHRHRHLSHLTNCVVSRSQNIRSWSGNEAYVNCCIIKLPRLHSQLLNIRRLHAAQYPGLCKQDGLIPRPFLVGRVLRLPFLTPPTRKGLGTKL